MKIFRIKTVLYDADSGEFLDEKIFSLRNYEHGFRAEDSGGWAREILRRIGYFALPERGTP